MQIAAPTPGIRYPTIDAIANTNIPMQARSIGNQYLWRPTVGLSNPNIRDPYFRLNMPMEYQIKITNDRGCVTVDTIMTRMQFAIDIQVPTAFTPNGDGLNDVLRVLGTNIRSVDFLVYNQWGQKIFESRDQRKGWNGKYKFKEQPGTTYTYYVRAVLLDGKVIVKKGNTILLR
jgi:gliding motility-associated-like protein